MTDEIDTGGVPLPSPLRRRWRDPWDRYLAWPTTGLMLVGALLVQYDTTARVGVYVIAVGCVAMIVYSVRTWFWLRRNKRIIDKIARLADEMRSSPQ